MSDKQRLKQWLPDLLQDFLSTLVNNELKASAIGHSIVQAVRPNTVNSPLLFSVGASLAHVFGSQWLLTMLNRIGYCIWYDEVVRFKQSVLQCNINDRPENYPQSFTQVLADNVDHNTCTLDGVNTVHFMRIQSMTTSTTSDNTSMFVADFLIPRLSRCNSSVIIRNRSIPLLQYCSPTSSPLSTLSFSPWLNLKTPYIMPDTCNIDLMWHCSWFSQDEHARPNWSGFMYEYHAKFQSSPVAKCDIRLHPIIDMNPNDMSCVYSTLQFIISWCIDFGIVTPCVTFD